MDYRTNPPVPWVGRCVVRGMIGYHTNKLQQRLEARADRQASDLALAPRRIREALITRVARTFRYLDVWSIAGLMPVWDPCEFKTRVLEAQYRFLLEMKRK
jgi:hypothetical protein